LNFYERFFTGDAIAGFVGSLSPHHGVADLLVCLRRYYTKLFLGSRHRPWRRLNMPATYGPLLLGARARGHSGFQGSVDADHHSEGPAKLADIDAASVTTLNANIVTILMASSLLVSCFY
jgi:hypothetical protein